VAEFFALGSVLHAPQAVAAGWAAHNIVWRFETSTGIWAVKQIGCEQRPISTAITISPLAAIGMPQGRP
jgi:1,2-phenylacetyl-CoA epoxidase PaaB subunit